MTTLQALRGTAARYDRAFQAARRLVEEGHRTTAALAMADRVGMGRAEA